MTTTRFRTVLASAIAGAALVTLPIGAARAAKKEDDRAVVHVLNRLGYGPTPAAIAQVKSAGIGSYIEAQLHPERLADTGMAARLAPFTTLAKTSRQLAEEYFVPAMIERRDQKRQSGQAPDAAAPGPETPPARTPEQMQLARMQRTVVAELSQQRILRAAYSEKQLEEALVDFWMNHFNVFVGKGQVRLYLTEYERDVVRPRVLGKFRDLLAATAQSPAMLFYLDNWQSTAPPGAATSAQAQRARELSRRRPIRVDPSGRQRRRLPDADMADGQMARVQPPQARTRGLNENYARELMELHTLGVDGGYTQKDVQEVARAFTGWTIGNPRLGGGFLFDPRRHDDGEKVVLGHRIKAGGGEKDGEEVLDLLVRHPSTARFIATKLARRFVADDPPAALVDRAARRFKDTDGDIREVVRTIVTSPEFLAESSWRAKTKSPYEFVVSAVRVSGLDVANALPLVQSLRDLGMPLYGAQPPTGYPDKAEAWVNSGALLNRMNFALALTGGQLRALRATAQSPAATAGETSRRLADVALAGEMSAPTAATVAKATTPAQASALILGSPEFQKR
jgi:uncharacterized protein (DUF1800 family)